MKKLKDKVAIVTGATSGIGLGIVEEFAKEGAKVVFCGRREETGKEIESRLKEAGHDVTFVRADVTVDSDLENLVEKTLEIHGRIDSLVNNAGILRNYSLLEMDMKRDYDDVFNINVRSYFLAIKLVSPVMVEQGKGEIINIASIGGLGGSPMLTSYGSSKAAVINMTKGAAKELASQGVRVNAIAPGIIYSEMMPRGTEFTEYALAATPMGRGGEPEEIGRVAVFLASDDSSFVTGSTIAVDGGASA